MDKALCKIMGSFLNKTLKTLKFIASLQKSEDQRLKRVTALLTRVDTRPYYIKVTFQIREEMFNKWFCEIFRKAYPLSQHITLLQK